MQARLKKLYYTPDGFQTASELLDEYNKKYTDSITMDDVKQFISSQYINQVYKPASKFNYQANSKFDVTKPNEIHVIDILSVYKDRKTGYKYILTLVDIASRYKAGAPMTTKQPAEVVKALRYIYKNNPDLKIPSRIIADSGTEFRGDFAKFCEDNDITLQISPPNHHKPQGHVEVLNAMLAQRLYKILEIPDDESDDKFDKSWPANLQSALDKLNAVKYKSINMRPIDAIKRDYVKQPQYSKKVLQKINANEFEVFDQVRYLLPKDDPEFGIRRRATDPVWSTAIYTIYNIHKMDNKPNLYFIESANKRIPYGFTSVQLQRATLN